MLVFPVQTIGGTLEQNITEAHSFARRFNCATSFVFNGIELYCTKNGNTLDTMRNYENKKLEREQKQRMMREVG